MSLRVLHVVASTQRRGAEIFAAALMGTLNELGVEQRVAVLRAADADGVRFPAPFVTLSDGGRTLPVLGVEVVAVRRLRAAVRDQRPDIVQVHGGEALKVAMAAGIRVPVVYRRIGGVPPWLASGSRRRVYARLMRRVAAVVTVADSLREETVRVFGLSPSMVVTIPNGVDPASLLSRRDREAVRDELGIPWDAAVTVAVGALVPEKDPLAALDIMAPLLRERPDAVHLVVGDGSLRAQVQERADAAPRSGAVRVLGRRDDVGDLLHAADVLIFASPPGGMEGMPASLIEAGLCGLPVVGFDVAGAREVVDDGVTGHLVPWGDAAGFRARLIGLLDDPAARKAMGDRARERCARFDIRAVAPHYLDLYRRVAA
jgi:glycosyltransferase involved in cell wall biosynthesis